MGVARAVVAALPLVLAFSPPPLARTRGARALGVSRDLEPPPPPGADAERAACSAYWARHGRAWAQPLALFDVQAALVAGELTIRPGSDGREGSDLCEAVDNVQAGELEVRHRFRGASAAALLPRWRRLAARRDELRATGAWDAAVAAAPDVRLMMFGGSGAVPRLFERLAEQTAADADAEARWVTCALVELYRADVRALALARAREIARAELAARAGGDLAASGRELALPAGADDEDAVLDALAARGLRRSARATRARAFAASTRDAAGRLSLAAAFAAWLGLNFNHPALAAMERAMDAL